MGSIGTNEMKSGTKVLIDGEPFSVIDNEYRKPGKGQATNTIRIRNLKTGRVLDRTLKSGDTLEEADIEEQELQYLYNDGDFWHFMNPTSFEQLQTGKIQVGESAQWLKEQDTVRVLFWNGMPMSVTPPNSVNLRVVVTDPGMRGDTVTGGSKPAKLESGAMVKVPLFINEGEMIKVDTRTGEYISRVKE